jgi:hypothetical protein
MTPGLGLLPRVLRCDVPEPPNGRPLVLREQLAADPRLERELVDPLVHSVTGRRYTGKLRQRSDVAANLHAASWSRA